MGIVALSNALGMSRGAASQWTVVPSERVLDVCALLQWRVTPHELRPDLYPNPCDALPESMRGPCRPREHVEPA